MMERYWVCPYCGHITHGRFKINSHLAECPKRMGKPGQHRQASSIVSFDTDKETSQ